MSLRQLFVDRLECLPVQRVARRRVAKGREDLDDSGRATEARGPRLGNRALYRPSRPRRRRRHQGPARERAARASHQMDHQRQGRRRSSPARCSSRRSTRTASTKATHELPFAFSMMLPAFRGVEAVRGIEGLTNPRGFIADRQVPAQPDLPERLRGRRLRRDPAGRQDAAAGRRAEDRLHDRIDGDGDRREHRAR